MVVGDGIGVEQMSAVPMERVREISVIEWSLWASLRSSAICGVSIEIQQPGIDPLFIAVSEVVQLVT